jgi:hypothetical protein
MAGERPISLLSAMCGVAQPGRAAKGAGRRHGDRDRVTCPPCCSRSYESCWGDQAAFHCWRTSRRVPPPGSRMRSAIVVLDSALFCQSLTSTSDVNSSKCRNSSRNLLLNDSTYGFSQGEPRGIQSGPDPLPVHHSCSAWAMNSGPLSSRHEWPGTRGFIHRKVSLELVAPPDQMDEAW